MSDLSTRTDRAVAAAVAAGRTIGVTSTEPKVLHDVFSVVVHLAPEPVVVRVPVVLPSSLQSDLAAQAVRQSDELAVVSWLASNGHPVVPPAHGEPVQLDGFSMTLWQLVDVPEGEPDYVKNVGLTPSLHAALRDYPGSLPFLSPLGGYIPDSLGLLEKQPELIGAEDLARARAEWEVVAPVLTSHDAFTAAFPEVTVQPIHGDSPPFNLIGERFSDFEDATLGPVEWDLTLVGPDLGAVYDAAAVELGLRPLDERVLRVLDVARMLQVVSCLALVPQLPMLADGLQQPLAAWRAMPQLTAV
ncbi:phosphotransferase [Lentzea tibetensis]|uniref:Phosphotransferase n=1 Tax=Lentzea tibetensis TaxID=2591470 RepID=A0A563EYI5_9PSEU|nr:phosphotransferase [Lentzea tibetensis]TWP52683.1 phosphotransferase [Lentzea tibetensis]